MLDTLNNVKSRLGISDGTLDTFLTAQITLIGDAIEGYCRRSFTSASWVQTFYREDYNPSKMMELFHYPVSAVASIVEDTVTLDSSLYRVHGPTGRIIRPPFNALAGPNYGMFFWALQTDVTYTGGITPVPTPVLSVLDSLVLERYNKKTSGVDLNFGRDVQRISIPGALSIDFDYKLTDTTRTDAFGIILGNNLNILDHYRSERAIIGESKMIYLATSP